MLKNVLRKQRLKELTRLELCILIETCTGLNRSQQMIYPNKRAEAESIESAQHIIG